MEGASGTLSRLSHRPTMISANELKEENNERRSKPVPKDLGGLLNRLTIEAKNDATSSRRQE